MWTECYAKVTVVINALLCLSIRPFILLLLFLFFLYQVAKRFEKRDLLMPVTEATPTSDGASTTPSSDDVLKGTDSQHVATASGDSIDVEEEVHGPSLHTMWCTVCACIQVPMKSLALKTAEILVGLK